MDFFKLFQKTEKPAVFHSIFEQEQQSVAIKMANAIKEAQQKSKEVDNTFLERVRQINGQIEEPKVATLKDVSVGTDFYDAFDEFGHLRGLGLGAVIGSITAKPAQQPLSGLNEIENPFNPLPDVKTKPLNIEQMQALIDQIHSEFNNAGNQLLKQAQEIVEQNRVDEVLDEKAKRLSHFGFKQSKDVLLNQRNDVIKQKLAKEKAYIEAYYYFQTKYPNYKLITEEKIKELCQKYNLVYGEVTDYRGFVPEKNLKEIEEFFKVIQKEDLCYEKRYSSSYAQYHNYPIQRFKTWNDIEEISAVCPLQIAAPISDFDMRGKKIENYQIQDAPIQPLDPVVSQKVMYKNEVYLLIATAWGMEASDPIVVNPKFN